MPPDILTAWPGALLDAPVLWRRQRTGVPVPTLVYVGWGIHYDRGEGRGPGWTAVNAPFPAPPFPLSPLAAIRSDSCSRTLVPPFRVMPPLVANPLQILHLLQLKQGAVLIHQPGGV